jgi:Methyltransferase domain
VTAQAATHMQASGLGSLIAYWRFYRAVAAAQLAAWLKDAVPDGALIVDVSGPHLPCAAQAAAAGHTVVRAAPPVSFAQESLTAAARPPRPPRPPLAAADGSRLRALKTRSSRGSITTVQADLAALPFIDDRSVGGVIADDRSLSRHLFTEQVISEIARVLRPGGSLIACFDSLVLGMAILAEQRHWAELTDLPSAEVVLVPWPDGTFTRCFGIEQLRELFAEAGLEIGWIRPRTVLSPTAVEHVLGRNGSALTHLVRAELAAHPDESVGIHLIVNARKPRR